MNKQIQTISQDLGQLAEDAGVLIAATANMAEAEVAKARDRLAEALELGKDNIGRVCDSAVQKTKAASATVREHPYQAVGFGIGIGALIGLFVTFQYVCKRDHHSQA